MAAFVETAQKIGAVSPPISIASTTAIGARLANLLPITMIGLGLVLTVIWSGGLVWLLLLIV
jgi:hypothetical protein